MLVTDLTDQLHSATDMEHVIRSLTQTSPQLQREAVYKYFIPTASFVHPFCRTGSSSNSRWLIWNIYRWYKILSPRIDLTINNIGTYPQQGRPLAEAVGEASLRKDASGVAFDKTSLRVYVDLNQVFRLWFVPFYAADLHLVAVVDLIYDEQRRLYFIRSQNDLYQVEDLLKLLKHFLPGARLVYILWQYCATLLCVLGATLLWPITWYEQNILA